PENGGDNQKWKLVPVGGNWWKIQSVSSRLVLDVEHASHDNHARILQFPDNGGRNQQVGVVPAVGDGAVNEGFLPLPMGPQTTFCGVASRERGKVLDVPASNAAAQTPIQQYDANNGFNQDWQLIRV